MCYTFTTVDLFQLIVLLQLIIMAILPPGILILSLIDSILLSLCVLDMFNEVDLSMWDHIDRLDMATRTPGV